MLALLSTILLAATAPQAATPSHLQTARAELQVERIETLEFDVSELEAGLAWQLQLQFEGVSYAAWLEPTIVRSSGYKAIANGVDGRVDCTVPSLGTWRGPLNGLPGAVVAATKGPDGLRIAVLGGPEGDWFVQPLSSLAPSAGRGLHVAYRGVDPFLSGVCGTDTEFSPVGPPSGGETESGPNCLSMAEVGFDLNYERYLYSSDVLVIQSEMDAYMNAVAAIYIRDLLIDYTISHLEIRTSAGPPYTSNDPGTLLNALRAEWTSTLAGVQRDMAHLLVGQEMDTNVIGLAYVGVTCSQAWAHGLTQGNLGFGGVVSVLSHEFGHNWNAPHCLDTDSCNQMCGGCTVFGPNTVKRIKDFTAAIGCLDPWPAASTPVNPYAAPDFAQGYGPMQLDLLANDHDGNCEALTLSVAPTSPAGAMLSVLVGAGPAGQDLLQYIPPSISYEGTDTFPYTLTDSSGLTATAQVSVVQANAAADLVAHYRLDNIFSSELIDSSIYGQDGNFWDSPNQGLSGAANGTNYAVRFAGAPQRARHPDLGSPLHSMRENLSVALWVRPEQLTGRQRYYGNGGSWSVGQRDGQLMFTTHGIKDYYSVTALTANTWQHVAFVFTPGHDVRFFLNGVLLSQAAGNQPAAVSPFSGWFLATHNDQDEYFVGTLDDIQVYDNALEDGQVASLFANPGQELLEDCASWNYCQATPSSIGVPVSMLAQGSLAVQDDNFFLGVVGAPPGQFGLFLYGPSFQLSPAAGGWICVGNPVRMGATQIDGLTSATWQVNLSMPAAGGSAIVGGSTWCFQFWYRDPALGAGSNFSDGLVVLFCD
ncbi:MAG: hypothetical protein ACI8QC_003667 [Planctomycetota bacterium]|jgi:hypothetical protein